MEQPVKIKAEWDVMEDNEESSFVSPLDTVTMEQPVSIKVEWDVLQDHGESSSVCQLDTVTTEQPFNIKAELDVWENHQDPSSMDFDRQQDTDFIFVRCKREWKSEIEENTQYEPKLRNEAEGDVFHRFEGSRL
ncbi:uncharacterized protein [Anabrus simplex]|uniref:uncharacterized protein n=1 Tax=Anabrus simplex TaxID=316456 RepID=UPI0035A39579